MAHGLLVLFLLSGLLTAAEACPRLAKAARDRSASLLAASEADRRALRVLSRRPDKTARYDELILRHSQRRGLNPRLVKAIMAAESEFTPSALSPAGAQGLMQVMPATAEMVGVPRGSLWDAETNIRAGTAYLDYLVRRARERFRLERGRHHRLPDWVVHRIVAAYNAGPGALEGGWPLETRRYVRQVALLYRSPVCDFRPPAVMLARRDPAALGPGSAARRGFGAAAR